MLRHLSSLLYRQTSGKTCVLQRATPIQLHVDAAATVVIYSLEAKLSPPGQRVSRAASPRESRHIGTGHLFLLHRLSALRTGHLCLSPGIDPKDVPRRVTTNQDIAIQAGSKLLTPISPRPLVFRAR